MPFPIDFSRAFLFAFVFTVFLLFSTHGATEVSASNILLGLSCGLAFSVTLAAFELLAKKIRLRDFNTVLLGGAIGYFFGCTFIATLDLILEVAFLAKDSFIVSGVKVAVMLFGLYFGITFTSRAAEELHISLPFIRFKSRHHRKKDLLVDASLLADSRLMDVANTGILDQRLVIPRHLLNDLAAQSDSLDEEKSHQAKAILEVVKELEILPYLNIRFLEDEPPPDKDPATKLTKLARQVDADIFTADSYQLYAPYHDSTRIINIHALATALKPIMKSGQELQVKIQRQGKEPKQGVGYLEDGTMIVVNGGGDFVGQNIKAQVLSVKHTQSGRMIFTNATLEEMTQSYAATSSEATFEHQR